MRAVKKTMNPPKTVALVANGRKPAVRQAASRIVKTLKDFRRTVLTSPDDPAARLPGVRTEPLESLRRIADLVLVLGGDGTFLHAASLFADTSIPLFGVNFGAVGFLTGAAMADFRRAFGHILAGRSRLMRRLAVQGQASGLERPLVGLNEIALLRGAPLKTVHLSCFVNGRRIGAFKADGLVVSTPTGSTAYSLSAHGPVMDPDLEALLITPVCPHTLAIRPLVVPPDAVVELAWSAPDAEVCLASDGQTRVRLREGDRVTVRRAAKPFLIVATPDYDFFGHLGLKLGWIG